MKVRYISRKKSVAPNMTVGKIYTVIGIEANYYRLINDIDDPCLYEPEQFEVVDSCEPMFWVSEIDDDGERYAHPKEFNDVGFFEDYHDGVPEDVARFWSKCNELYGIQKNV